MSLVDGQVTEVGGPVEMQSDPVLKPWRWRVFSELKGAGLRAMAEDGKGGLWLA